MKVLHLADLHFRRKDLDDLKVCCDDVLSVASRENPDLVIIAGDLFDSQATLGGIVSREAINFIMSLSHHAPVLILKGTRSHDRDNLNIFFDTFSGGHEVKIVDKAMQLYLTDSPGDYSGVEFFRIDNYDLLLQSKEIDAPGIRLLISCLPPVIPEPGIDTGQYIRETLSGFADAAEEVDPIPHVLVGHFPVSGCSISDSYPVIGKEIAIGMSYVADAVIDLACLGHIHKAQQVDNLAFYSGSLYRVNFGERDETKGFYVHDISPDNDIKSTFHTVNARAKIEVELDFNTGLVDPQNHIEVAGADVKLNLIYREEQGATLDLDGIKSRFAAAHSLTVNMRRIQDEASRSEEISTAQTLRHKMVIWEKTRSNGENTPAPSVLTKADMIELLDDAELAAHVKEFTIEN